MSFQFVRSVLEATRLVHGGIRDLSRQVGKTVLTKVMITEEMKNLISPFNVCCTYRDIALTVDS